MDKYIRVLYFVLEIDMYRLIWFLYFGNLVKDFDFIIIDNIVELYLVKNVRNNGSINYEVMVLSLFKKVNIL